MSEENKDTSVSEENTSADSPAEAPQAAATEVKLEGLFAKKLGMSSLFTEEGKCLPVTVLKLDRWNVTQIKTKATDGYDAVQVSRLEKAEKNVHKSAAGHLKKAGQGSKGALICKEIRQEVPEDAKLGLDVAWSSLAKGDKVRLTGVSKGRGFTGVMKRWNFAGGPATHGAGFHRRPGSIGNCTFPGRVMAGRKMPGHFGVDKTTIKNVEVVDVQLDKGLLLVKGPVPGARNGLIQLLKQQ